MALCRSPFVTSGVRIGSPAITTRGMKEEECRWIAAKIVEVINDHENSALLEQICSEVHDLCSQFPIYENL